MPVWMNLESFLGKGILTHHFFKTYQHWPWFNTFHITSNAGIRSWSDRTFRGGCLSTSRSQRSWKPDVLNLNVNSSEEFLDHWQLHFVVTWYQLPHQREFDSDIGVAIAITGEALRSTDVWSIIYCGNTSTALCLRAFINKLIGMKIKDLRGPSGLPSAACIPCDRVSECLSDQPHFPLPPASAAPDTFPCFPWVCRIICLYTLKLLVFLWNMQSKYVRGWMGS